MAAGGSATARAPARVRPARSGCAQSRRSHRCRAAGGPYLDTSLFGAAAGGGGETGGAAGGEDVLEDLSENLALENVRQSLIRQEDSIIFSLIERAQFKRNTPVYTRNAIQVPGFTDDGSRYSLLEYTLRETEMLQGKTRRFTSPDEHPFFPDQQPMLVLPPLRFQPVLMPNAKAVNFNDRIYQLYTGTILDLVARDGNDNNYGSAALADITCLQAISKRVHFGKFVAEAKFRQDPATYRKLIEDRDADGIMETLTNFAVEERVTRRVTNKAMLFGQDITEAGLPSEGGTGVGKLDPEAIGELYTTWIMPMTKDVQVAYLLRRLDHEGDDSSGTKAGGKLEARGW